MLAATALAVNTVLSVKSGPWCVTDREWRASMIEVGTFQSVPEAL